MYIQKLGEDNNVFKDGIGYIHHYDFSRANLDETGRIEAITKVASICYDNPNAVGRESLYNRLKAEAMGLPSSSFEFVPVLLNRDDFDLIYSSVFDYVNGDMFTLRVEKYGEWIKEDGREYLLTNYRALLYDWESLNNAEYYDFTQFFNTHEECDIIRKHVKTFLYKFDAVTAQQHNRHRIALQGLSRRYVSGKKTEFEFYHSKNMNDDTNVKFINGNLETIDDTIINFDSISIQDILPFTAYDDKGDEIEWYFSAESIADLAVQYYYKALKAGVQPQEARRCLPQSMYTIIWSSFLPFQLDNYLKLRDDSHAQQEIRWMAQAMKKFLSDEIELAKANEAFELEYDADAYEEEEDDA